MTEIADSGGAVHGQVPVDAGGGAVQIPVDEGATVDNDDTGRDETPVPVDMGDDMAKEIDSQDGQVPIDEGTGAAPIPVSEEDDMTKVVEDKGDVHVQVPDGADMAKDEDGDNIVPTQVDGGGGAVQV